MASAFQGISTMSSALRAFQRQLDVTGHNISNVNTPGYSRQTVQLNEAIPSILTDGRTIMVGNGVSVESVNRVRDMFLEGRRNAAGADLGKAGASASGLSGVDSVVLASGQGGVSDALDAFYNAWSGLASNPSSAGAKLTVQTAGQTLATQVRNTWQGLQTLKETQTSQVDQALMDAQKSVDAIADLNSQIRLATAQGAEPNDLMDQRDQAVRDLSSTFDVNVSRFSDGSYVIGLNGINLVDTSGAHKVPTTWDAATGTLSDANGTYPVRSGSLAGTFDAINKIGGYQSQLDTLANNLRTQVNGLTSTGVNAAGATGLKFFNDVTPPATQTGAADLALDTVGVVGPPSSPGIGTNAQAIPTGTSGAASDGSIALALSKLRDQKVASLGNQTIGDYYNTLATTAARDIQAAKTAQSTQGAVVTQIDNQIQSVSGVSLDDEMANMLRYQRSYQAAAKVLSTLDSVTSDLINMLNR